MNPEFKDCLKKQKIKKFSRGKALVKKELKTAEEDLKTAKESFNNVSTPAVSTPSNDSYLIANGIPLDRGGGIRRDEKLLDIKSIRAAVIRLVHLSFLFLFLFFYEIQDFLFKKLEIF